MRISDWSSDVCSSDLDDALQTVELAFDEAEIGQDHVDAGIIRIGEGDAAIDHQPLAAAAVAIDVHADFARAAEREKQERLEERRVGKECVSTCQSRGSAKH